MAPLKLGYCHDKDGKINQRHLDFYEARASHLGAVISEPFYIAPSLRENPWQLGIDADDKIEGLIALTSLLHTQGVKAVAHINHPGKMANPAIPGNVHWSSSAVLCPANGVTPVTMDKGMMNHAAELLVKAAQRAEQAGFDMIELQTGYGYLLMQFLSPAANQRNDEYGGSLENRMRYPLEIVEKIIRSVGIPVICRITADEMLPGGWGPDEAAIFALALEKAGAKALHVTTGSACTSPMWYYQHMFTRKGKSWNDAARLAGEVSIPVIFHGRINSLEDVDRLKAEFGAKYISVGRALVADEHFVAKILGVYDEPVRPCLACSEACLGGVRQGTGLGCVVNPLVNTNLPRNLQKTKQLKKIAVVGAGLAGMQTAITLKQRGHEVTLFEKDQPGGQFVLAVLPPKKDSLGGIMHYQQAMIKKLGIPLVHRQADAETIEAGGFDEVVMATGSSPLHLPVEGLDDALWAELLNDLPQNKHIAIVGGGLIGCELALALLEGNNRISIIEMQDEIARDMEMLERKFVMQQLSNPRVQILTGHQLKRKQQQTLYLTNKQGDEVLLKEVDMVVVSAGMKPYRPIEAKIPVHYVGDAAKVGKALDAIHQGYALGNQI